MNNSWLLSRTWTHIEKKNLFMMLASLSIFSNYQFNKSIHSLDNLLLDWEQSLGRRVVVDSAERRGGRMNIHRKKRKKKKNHRNLFLFSTRALKHLKKKSFSILLNALLWEVQRVETLICTLFESFQLPPPIALSGMNESSKNSTQQHTQSECTASSLN